MDEVSNNRKPILNDHVKKGRVLIPPMLTIGKFEEVDWVDYILPELLWLGLLNEYHGLRLGADLSISLAKIVSELNKNQKKILYISISSYSKFSRTDKEKIVQKLHSEEKLKLFQKALIPLYLFYPECPINFLFAKKEINDNEDGSKLSTFKKTLSKFFDRCSIPSTFMQANAVYIAFVTDILKVKKGLALANFPEIEKFPYTEESKKIASSIRATVSGFFGRFSYRSENEWPNYFWNRGFELEPCEFEKELIENE